MKNCRLFALLSVTCAISACGGEVAGVSSSASPGGSSVGSGNGGSNGNGNGNGVPFASGGSTNGSVNTGNTGGTLGNNGTGGASGAGGAMVTSGAPGTGGNGPCLPENVCTATMCGSLVDPCGNVVDCGYTNCNASLCGTVTPGECTRCTPLTTADCPTLGYNCGSIPDGCGGFIDCGTCTDPDCCGCAGTANVCGSGSTYNPLPWTCIAGTKGCLCDSTGGCASGLTCDTTKNYPLCCSGTDCTRTCSGGGVAQCTPGITIPTATGTADNCGYPTSTFKENAFVCGIYATGGATGPTQIQGFFNDEWPLTLGCANTAYPVSPMTTTDLGDVMYPQLGDPTCNDTAGRPMRPSLFITDITADPNCRAGDQQTAGSKPYDAIGISGVWTYANAGTPVRPNQTATPFNLWNLGAGADPLPASVSNQCPCTGTPGTTACPGTGLTGKGYGAEVLFEAALISGHSYRLQLLGHDGDQTQGGDSGETCVNFCAGNGFCYPLTCADYPPNTLGPQPDGCNGVTEPCQPCMTTTCEQVCPTPSGGIPRCAAVYDPAVYSVACPQSDGCGGIINCYCPTG